MLIFLYLLAFFIFFHVIVSLGMNMYLEIWKIALTIFLSLVIGAPIGGLIVIFFGDILVLLNIVELSTETTVKFWLFAVPWGLLIGAIAMVAICFRHFKKAQELKYSAEHNQFNKRKNDEKAKRY